MVFLMLLFALFVHSETTSNVTNEDNPYYYKVKDAHPNMACRNQRSSTRPEESVVQQRIRLKGESQEFMHKLLKRVKLAATDNLRICKVIIQCFSYRMRDQTDFCKAARHNFDPTRFPKAPNQDDYPEDQSIGYALKGARYSLAHVSRDTGSPADFLRPNNLLDDLGTKTVSWLPLTPDQLKIVENNLNEHLEEFKKTSRISQKQAEIMLAVHNFDLESRRIGQPLSEQIQELKKKFVEKMSNERSKYLGQYIGIVSAFPIINYMPSSLPSPKEIHTAAMKMNVNAEKELANIISIEESLAKNTVPPLSSLDLLDYSTITEDLLREYPEYCTVAARLHTSKKISKLVGQAIIASPLLAATFLGSLPVAVAGATGLGLYEAYNSYQNLEGQKQSLYSTPINHGTTKADLDSVNTASRTLHRDLIRVPIGVIGVGAYSKGIKALGIGK